MEILPKPNIRVQSKLFFFILLVDGMLFGSSLGALHQMREVRMQTVSDEVRQNEMRQNEIRQNEVRRNGMRQNEEGKDQALQAQTTQLEASSVKMIALTFDDGPHKTYTPELLDGLKERGVRATFFLMGESIDGNEEIVKRMQEEGHLIGNHSYQHIPLTKANEDAVCNAVEKTETIIAEITGVCPQYLRPPYGDWNENLECRLDLTTVFWSVDSLDWKLKNTDKIVNRVEKQAEDGAIVLMHDIFGTSVEAALKLIDRLQKKGYTFVTVDELLID